LYIYIRTYYFLFQFVFHVLGYDIFTSAGWSSEEQRGWKRKRYC